MQCHEVNDLLSAYIDGMLEPSEHALAAAHLENCPLCRQEYRDLKDVVHVLCSLPQVISPADFRQVLRDKLNTIGPINSLAVAGAAVQPGSPGHMGSQEQIDSPVKAGPPEQKELLAKIEALPQKQTSGQGHLPGQRDLPEPKQAAGRNNKGFLVSLTRGRWPGLLAVAASLALTVGVAGAFYGFPGSYRSPDIASWVAREKGAAMQTAGDAAKNTTSPGENRNGVNPFAGEGNGHFAVDSIDNLSTEQGTALNKARGTAAALEAPTALSGDGPASASQIMADPASAGTPEVSGGGTLAGKRLMARAPALETGGVEGGQSAKAQLLDVMMSLAPPGSRGLSALGLGAAAGQEQPLLIKSASLTIQAGNVDQVKNNLVSLAGEFSGTVEEGSQGQYQLLVRVPLDGFELFVERAGMVGQLKKKEMRTRDATQEWQGLLEKIRQLQAPPYIGAAPAVAAAAAAPAAVGTEDSAGAGGSTGPAAAGATRDKEPSPVPAVPVGAAAAAAPAAGANWDKEPSPVLVLEKLEADAAMGSVEIILLPLN